jgi:type IV fimbrial biogenesis protein FimT
MAARIPAERGFTLVELLVAIAISAILLTIAVPSYRGARLNSQLRASANDLIGSINLARSEAIKRGTTVTLCASADGDNCGGAWNEGWLVLWEGDALHEPEIIQSIRGIPGGFKLIESEGNDTLRFRSTGVDTTAATFTWCRSSPSASQERVISMDATGRAFVKRTSTGDCS